MADEKMHMEATGRTVVPQMVFVALAACVATFLWTFTSDVHSPGISLAWANKDFANYWIAAQMVFDGNVRDLFQDHETYFAHMQAAFGPDYPWHNWSYPPHYLLTVLPLGFFGYKIGFVAYMLATFLLFCGALHLVSRRIQPLQFCLLVPAVIGNVLTAQNGFLTAALLLAGLAGRDTRPVLAGICIGLLTIKPQLGFLLPLLLLAERRWLVIAVASMTTAVLAVVSLALFGVESWTGYFDHVVPYQVDVMRHITGIFQHMMPSVFGSFRSLDLPFETAMTAHVPFAVFGFAVFCASLFLLKTPWARATSLVFATFVITPYSVTYDLVALSALVSLWPLAGTREGGRAQSILFATVAFLPILTPVLGLAGAPVTPVIVIAAWAAMLVSEGMFRRSPPWSMRITA